MAEASGAELPNTPPSAAWRYGLVSIFGAAWLLHFLPLDNFFYNDDAWNYALESERLLRGQGSSWVEGGSYFVHQNLMRLIGSLTFVVRYAAFELWMPGWHFPQIALHGLNAVLLAIWVRRLLPKASVDVALLSGLLFAVWPAWPHVVEWIGGTYDLLCGAFSLGALIAFQDRKSRLGVALYVLAMMSKETGVLLGPVLALQVLLTERHAGFRAAVQRLWPYAAAGVALVAVRLIQIRIGGSIDQAGLPARTIGFGLGPLFATGPTALLASLGVPGLAQYAVVSAGVAAGAMIVGFAVHRRSLPLPVVALGFVGGWFLLVPVLLMREEGLAFGPDEILYHARYTYLPLLLALPLLPLALYGAGSHTGGQLIVRRTLALALVVGCTVLTFEKVVRATHVDPPGPVVHQAFVDAPPDKSLDIYLLTNSYDEATWRMVLSRYYQYRFGTRFHVVQRGSWRVFSRRPEIPYGLDFKDYYLKQAKELFGPRPAQTVVISRNPNAVQRVSVPQVAAVAGAARPLDKPFGVVEDGRIDFEALGNGAYRLDVKGAQQDALHKPAMLAEELWLASAQIWGVRIKYRVVGPPARPGRSLWGRGQSELHWTSDSLPAAQTFVSFPLIRDGRDHTLDIALWLDPVWNAAPDIRGLGFAPGDMPGNFTLHSIELISRSK